MARQIRRSGTDPLLSDASGWAKPDITRSQEPLKRSQESLPDGTNATVTKGFVTAHKPVVGFLIRPAVARQGRAFDWPDFTRNPTYYKTRRLTPV